MKQRSFSEHEYAGKRKLTRRDKFLAQMDKLIPWSALIGALQPHYFPNSHKGGRPPIGLERMLRLYFVQQFYNLSDEALEDAVYDSQALRSFIGIDLSRENVPDATTVLKFRRWLEQNQLTKELFARINEHLNGQGMSLRQGTIVDATIIHAPSSTKNKKGERDPEMHSTKKGNQYYFGMKAHIGVDQANGLVHSLSVTAANVHDVTQVDKLLHGEEDTVWGDSGYIGVEKREEHEHRKKIKWLINRRPKQKLPSWFEGKEELYKKVEELKSKVRSKVEHAFGVLKHHFGYRKVRYKGLMKMRRNCIRYLRW